MEPTDLSNSNSLPSSLKAKLQKWKPYFVPAGVALVLVLAIFFYYRFKYGPVDMGPVIHFDRGGPCPGKEMVFEMKDDRMQGVINQGEKFTVITNYYACNDIQRDDLVYYQFSTQREPIVRIARAVQGDRFILSKDKTRAAWNLSVNGTLIKGFDAYDKETPYYYGGSSPAVLSLYGKARKDILQPGEIILFAARPPGSFDSGIFGVASIRDVVGKVIPPEERKLPGGSFVSLKKGSAEATATPEETPRATPEETPKPKSKTKSKAKPKSS